MIRLPQNAALIVVDVQKGFDHPKWGARNNPGAEEKIAEMLAAWRETGRPVFHVQHLSTLENSPLHPRNPGYELKEIARPAGNEPLFQKNVNSAFIGTQLENSLRARGVKTVFIVGLTTPHCISTSVRMAGNLGFEVFVPADAVAAFELAGPDGKRYSAEEVHNFSLASLHEEFATVVDSKTILDSLQQT
jgi:nicotinamidase-related amidase